MDIRPVEGVNGTAEEADILRVLGKYGIEGPCDPVGNGQTLLREFLWSEEMADACVYLLENINFSDIIGIRGIQFGLAEWRSDGAETGLRKVDLQCVEGRYGGVPQLGEIRNRQSTVGFWANGTDHTQLAELV